MDSLKAIQAYKALGQPKVTTMQSASKPTAQNYSSKMNSYKSSKLTYTKQVTSSGQKASTSIDVKKPTAYVGNNTFRSKDGKFKTSTSGPRPASSNRTNNYANHPLSDSKGNPLCFKCGEVGWARDCPNQTKVFAIGMGDNHPSEVAVDPEG